MVRNKTGLGDGDDNGGGKRPDWTDERMEEQKRADAAKATKAKEGVQVGVSSLETRPDLTKTRIAGAFNGYSNGVDEAYLGFPNGKAQRLGGSQERMRTIFGAAKKHLGDKNPALGAIVKFMKANWFGGSTDATAEAFMNTFAAKGGTDAAIAGQKGASIDRGITGRLLGQPDRQELGAAVARARAREQVAANFGDIPGVSAMSRHSARRDRRLGRRSPGGHFGRTAAGRIGSRPSTAATTPEIRNLDGQAKDCLDSSKLGTERYGGEFLRRIEAIQNGASLQSCRMTPIVICKEAKGPYGKDHLSKLEKELKYRSFLGSQSVGSKHVVSVVVVPTSEAKKYAEKILAYDPNCGVSYGSNGGKEVFVDTTPPVGLSGQGYNSLVALSQKHLGQVKSARRQQRGDREMQFSGIPEPLDLTSDQELRLTDDRPYVKNLDNKHIPDDIEVLYPKNASSPRSSFAGEIKIVDAGAQDLRDLRDQFKGVCAEYGCFPILNNAEDGVLRVGQIVEKDEGVDLVIADFITILASQGVKFELGITDANLGVSFFGDDRFAFVRGDIHASFDALGERAEGLEGGRVSRAVAQMQADDRHTTAKLHLVEDGRSESLKLLGIEVIDDPLLAARVKTFVGRIEELKKIGIAIKESLETGPKEALVIDGDSGEGKTALAAHVSIDRFPNAGRSVSVGVPYLSALRQLRSEVKGVIKDGDRMRNALEAILQNSIDDSFVQELLDMLSKEDLEGIAELAGVDVDKLREERASDLAQAPDARRRLNTYMLHEIIAEFDASIAALEELRDNPGSLQLADGQTHFSYAQNHESRVLELLSVFNSKMNEHQAEGLGADQIHEGVSPKHLHFSVKDDARGQAKEMLLHSIGFIRMLQADPERFKTVVPMATARKDVAHMEGKPEDVRRLAQQLYGLYAKHVDLGRLVVGLRDKEGDYKTDTNLDLFVGKEILGEACPDDFELSPSDRAKLMKLLTELTREGRELGNGESLAVNALWLKLTIRNILKPGGYIRAEGADQVAVLGIDEAIAKLNTEGVQRGEQAMFDNMFNQLPDEHKKTLYLCLMFEGMSYDVISHPRVAAAFQRQFGIPSLTDIFKERKGGMLCAGDIVGINDRFKGVVREQMEADPAYDCREMRVTCLKSLCHLLTKTNLGKQIDPIRVFELAYDLRELERADQLKESFEKGSESELSKAHTLLKAEAESAESSLGSLQLIETFLLRKIEKLRTRLEEQGTDTRQLDQLEARLIKVLAEIRMTFERINELLEKCTGGDFTDLPSPERFALSLSKNLDFIEAVCKKLKLEDPRAIAARRVLDGDAMRFSGSQELFQTLFDVAPEYREVSSKLALRACATALDKMDIARAQELYAYILEEEVATRPQQRLKMAMLRVRIGIYTNDFGEETEAAMIMLKDGADKLAPADRKEALPLVLEYHEMKFRHSEVHDRERSKEVVAGYRGEVISVPDLRKKLLEGVDGTKRSGLEKYVDLISEYHDLSSAFYEAMLEAGGEGFDYPGAITRCDVLLQSLYVDRDLGELISSNEKKELIALINQLKATTRMEEATFFAAPSQKHDAQTFWMSVHAAGWERDSDKGKRIQAMLNDVMSFAQECLKHASSVPGGMPAVEARAAVNRAKAIALMSEDEFLIKQAVNTAEILLHALPQQGGVYHTNLANACGLRVMVDERLSLESSFVKDLWKIYKDFTQDVYEKNPEVAVRVKNLIDMTTSDVLFSSESHEAKSALEENMRHLARAKSIFLAQGREFVPDFILYVAKNYMLVRKYGLESDEAFSKEVFGELLGGFDLDMVLTHEEVEQGDRFLPSSVTNIVGIESYPPDQLKEELKAYLRS